MKLMLYVVFNYIIGDKIKRLSMNVAFKFILIRRVSINYQHTTKIIHDSTDMAHVTSVHKYNIIHQRMIKGYYKPSSIE